MTKGEELEAHELLNKQSFCVDQQFPLLMRIKGLVDRHNELCKLIVINDDTLKDLKFLREALIQFEENDYDYSQEALSALNRIENIKISLIEKKASERNHLNNPTGKPYCCYQGCGRDATWDIYGDPPTSPEDNTHACDDHVGHLLENRPFRIVPLP